MTKSIAWCLLTYNRAEIAAKALPQTFASAGYPISEIVWVDNGSTQEQGRKINETIAAFGVPVVQVHFPENRGVAKGYNAAMAMASCDYIMITGMDFLFPVGWLEDMVNVLENAPQCGMSLIYSRDINKCPERIRGPVISGATDIGGAVSYPLRIQEAMPIERRLISRKLQRECGYFNETLGLYGGDDLALAYTTERIFKEKGLKSYCLIDRVATHLGCEGIEEWNGKDNKEYWEMKRREVQDRSKWIKLENLRANNDPVFNPYA